MQIFIGLGSNLGKREQNLRKAIGMLEQAGVLILRKSAIYESEPVGVTAQPWFLNMVMMAEISKSEFQISNAREFLVKLHEIERALGRERGVGEEKGGARTMDLDLLFWGDEIMEEDGLIVPHPRMAERKFVLMPLAEIAPEKVHPIFKKSVAQLLKECGDKSIVGAYGNFS